MALARSPQPERPDGIFAWWLGELHALLPRRWREAAPRRQALLLLLDEPFVRVFERRRRQVRSMGVLPLPAAAGSGTPDEQDRAPLPKLDRNLRRALERHREATVLVLGQNDALTCTDLLPAAAEDDLPQIMAHKIDLLTPWTADQVYAAQRIVGERPDGMLEVLLAVAPRRVVDRARARLAALGVQPQAVDLALDGDLHTAGVDLLQGSVPVRRRGWLTQLLGFLLIAALLTGIGFGSYAIYRRHVAIQEQQQLVQALEARLADLPELRGKITAMQAQINFLIAQRRDRPSPLIVIEVLSRLLPDSVWLTDFTLDGNEVVITGLAEDASPLVALVEGAPHFEQVRFNTPSTRVRMAAGDGEEHDMERFSLRAVVKAPVEPPL